MACAKIAGVLLAAGRGTRFGGNKLEAILDGDLLGSHAARTLAGIGCGFLFAVQDPAHLKLAAALRLDGFVLLDNLDPAAGLSHSLSVAARAVMATGADALLVCLADMPLVTATHLGSLVAAHREYPDRVIASQAADIRSPPAIFPRAVWDRLTTISGDEGARQMLMNAVPVAARAETLSDIDTKPALAAIQTGKRLKTL